MLAVIINLNCYIQQSLYLILSSFSRVQITAIICPYLFCYSDAEVVLHLKRRGCTHPTSQIAQVTKFCMVAHNICGTSVWNLFHVTLLAPRILKWILNFWKICGPLL